jgi:hypothetical protein
MKKSSSLRGAWEDLSPLQKFAVMGIVFLVAMWAIFDRLAPELITLFGGILAAEEGRKAIREKDR